jgi:formamidopyrimidine-DNA glycosylase
MPELPEVEVTKTFLNQSLQAGDKITAVKLNRKNLRYEIPTQLAKLVTQSTFLKVERRAKYLIWCFDNFQMLNHLGMTGTWRILKKKEAFKKHDHIIFTLKNQNKLVYSDPRRFGYVDITQTKLEQTLTEHRYFKHLGPEPFDQAFSGEYLKKLAKNVKAPVKNFIMNQKIVVGVGNIYACESLFLSSILPHKNAHKVSLEKYKLLAKHIRAILKKAIIAGGSSISDFKTGDNQNGYFQMQFKVYQKTGLPCFKCKTPIKKMILAGRSSFYCPSCQS